MDIERTMEFILQQQAHFASEIDKTNAILRDTAERHKATEELLFKLTQNQVVLQQTIVDVANAQARASEILATSAERQVATDEAMSRLAERQSITEESINRLAERQSTTEDNLNVLVLTVERHIANHK